MDILSAVLYAVVMGGIIVLLFVAPWLLIEWRRL